jgi:hypothetical protein
VLRAETRDRVSILGEDRNDNVSALLAANRVVAVGTGVLPGEYGQLAPLLQALDGELAATRKVTDREWLPRTRQVGLTGHSLAPDLYVTLGVAGKFSHMVASRNARTIVSVNTDPAAPVFEWADVGLVADWHEVVPLLARAIQDLRRDSDAKCRPADTRDAAKVTGELHEVVRARLTDVRPCSVRSDYRELHFSMQGRPWSWCFPTPIGQATTAASALMFSPASHGVMAKVITAEPGGRLGPHSRLDVDGVGPAVAAGLAISGLPVLIHPSLAISCSPEHDEAE